jgi:serine/threonine-protein kinase
MALASGTHLGPYEILAPIAGGGMGEVYRARDTRLKREVAVKVLSERLASTPDALQRFEREARAVAALSHPNILAIHDIGNQHGTCFAVTELLDGETLRRRLARAPIPWRKAVEIGAAIADGLAAAHAKGVVHRDLKPENVFLTSDGHVKILDFGLARIDPPAGLQKDQTELASTILGDPGAGTVRPTPDLKTDTQLAHTDPGTVMGTVPYMSPEQVRGVPVDVRSDIFSLGSVLYEMVTGQCAFGRETGAETMTAILREDPREIADSGKVIPLELQRVIMHCLEKSPEQRFQSARDLAFDLRAISIGSDVTRAVPAGTGLGSRPAAWMAGVAILLVTLGTGTGLYLLWDRDNPGPVPAIPPQAGPISSIAVLPFVNVGDDPNTEYLSDGIAESVMNSLSQLPKLKVMSRGSVFRYKGQDVEAKQVGRDLSVQAVLTGRVVQRGDALSISVSLDDARDNSHIWGDTYSRKLADLFALQEEMSREISENLRLKLSGEDRQRLSKRATDDPEAYQLYLQGRYHWNKRTEEAISRGIEYFQQAINKDPSYALAHAGLADCYNMLAAYGTRPPKETYPKAEAAANRALQIDDSLAEAHTSLAWVKHEFAWDWAGAQAGFERAIALNPSYATAHHWYAYHLMLLGRSEDAAARIKRAQELDPLSLIINANTGYRLYLARQYDPAIEQFRKTLQLDANFAVAHSYLGQSYEQKEMQQDAIVQFQKAVSFSAGNTEFLAALGHAHAIAGERDEARKVLDELTELSARQYVPPFHFAVLHAGLGDHDAAFGWLERAYAQRDGFLTYLKVDPRLDPLRGDARFADLLRRVGLTP